MHIPLIHEHLLNQYFVRWIIGQATKGKHVKNIEMQFSRPLFEVKVKLFLCTFLLFMSIYSINILSEIVKYVIAIFSAPN